jgi:hypothetical protein
MTVEAILEAKKKIGELQQTIRGLRDKIDMLDGAIENAGMDLFMCRLCECFVISIPDGLALCKRCAEKAGE